MTAITDYGQIVALVKRQHAAYLQHPVLGPVLRERPPGGFFALFDNTTGKLVAQPALIVPFQDGTRAMECRNLSIDKGGWLIRRPTDILSRQSKGHPSHPGTGAVRGKRWIAVYSGDPGQVDELKMLALLVEIKDITKFEMIDILNRFPNDYVPGPPSNDLFLD